MKDEADAEQKEAQQEPVAWRIWSPDGTNVYQYTEDGDGEPLYTQPNPALLARHDRLEALLRDAGRFIGWQCFGDCRALSTPDDGAIPTAADVFNAIERELKYT